MRCVLTGPVIGECWLGACDNTISGAILMHYYSNNEAEHFMSRQSISLTKPNEEWLLSHIATTQEYSSKSELINDLIRKARRSEEINRVLVAAESSGFTELSEAEILTNIKAKVKK